MICFFLFTLNLLKAEASGDFDGHWFSKDTSLNKGSVYFRRLKNKPAPYKHKKCQDMRVVLPEGYTLTSVSRFTIDWGIISGYSDETYYEKKKELFTCSRPFSSVLTVYKDNYSPSGTLVYGVDKGGGWSTYYQYKFTDDNTIEVWPHVFD